ncbi:hypothetical protein SALBM311S_02507 [Streptomyces alboniger]
MLLPAKAEVARHLRRYRAWERRMLAAPADCRIRSTFEDSGYTLCVLMGKRCAREAADAAERCLRTTLVASSGRRAGDPVRDRSPDGVHRYRVGGLPPEGDTFRRGFVPPARALRPAQSSTVEVSQMSRSRPSAAFPSGTSGLPWTAAGGRPRRWSARRSRSPRPCSARVTTRSPPMSSSRIPRAGTAPGHRCGNWPPVPTAGAPRSPRTSRATGPTASRRGAIRCPPGGARPASRFRPASTPGWSWRRAPNCTNLPATHEFLRRVRSDIDTMYPDTVLLAEANQWPEDVVDYFGDYAGGGDESHMAFPLPGHAPHLHGGPPGVPLPVSEILAKTPAIPSNCQWGIFLRNHDELTLEMVTDEERDYMWAEYAKDPRMRANIGIRRRLAPLLDNDRDTRSSCSPPCCCPCRARRSSTTATRSAWATTSGSATGTPYGPRRSGPPTATPASRHGRPGPSCASPPSWTRSTATRSPTSRRRWPRRPRCCTGPAA